MITIPLWIAGFHPSGLRCGGKSGEVVLLIACLLSPGLSVMEFFTQAERLICQEGLVTAMTSTAVLVF